MRMCCQRLILVAVCFLVGGAASPVFALDRGAALSQNPTDLVYYALPRMEVPIGPEGSSLIRINLAVQVARQDIPALEAQMPRIMDRLNVLFPRLSREDIEDSKRMSFLRHDMVAQLNGVASPVVIRDVSFQRLLMM